MYLKSLASAFPSTVWTQPQCLEVLRDEGPRAGLTHSSMRLLEKVLSNGGGGVSTRHFAADEPRALFGLDAEGLNRSFERAAPVLGAEALARAAARAEVGVGEIDALVVATCTGYLCPGLSSYVAEELGLSANTYLLDLVGLGCGAAIPAMRAVDGLTKAQPDAVVALVCVEVCSAAFHLENDAGVLISLCLFGDGASASLWNGKRVSNAWQAHEFQTVHAPAHRDKIRFVNSGGRLKNQLDRAVPELAANAVGELFDSGGGAACSGVVSHGGGRDVIEALEARLEVGRLEHARSVMRDYGNLSSPSVLVALEQQLAQESAAPGSLWLTSFGAGFAAHACQLRRSE